VDRRDEGETKLRAIEIAPFEAVAARGEVRLRVDAQRAEAGVIRELATLIRDFPGEAPVFVDLDTSLGPKRLEFGPSYRVAPTPDFYAEVKHLLGEAESAEEKHHPSIPAGEFDDQELLRLEKETLGLYVSEHPLEQVRGELRRKTDCALGEIERRRDGEVVTVGGIVSALKQVTTKRGEPMVFVTLDDPTGSAEVVVFNSTYAAAREHLEADRILVVKGRVDHKQAGETKLVALEVSPFESVPVRRDVRLRIDAREAPAGLIRELATLVREFPGDAPVFVSLETSVGERTLALGPGYRVKPDADFFAEVRALLGETALA